MDVKKRMEMLGERDTKGLTDKSKETNKNYGGTSKRVGGLSFVRG